MASCKGSDIGDIALDGTATAGLALVLDTVHGIYQNWKLPAEKDNEAGIAGNSSSDDFDSAGMQDRLINTARSAVSWYTMEEVSTHNAVNDCWIIVKNKVYDVTHFARKHPGGEVIYTHGGKDATDVFTTFHAPSTWALLKPLQVGELKNAPGPETALLDDFRQVRAALLREGLFKSNKLFYAWKFMQLLLLLAASISIIAASKELPSIFLSAVLLALFWQQSGWLAHDFLHHQVFSWRPANNWVGGFLLGNVVQGLSGAWWKTKHNKHHACPNETEEEGRAPVDPDIDTLPFIAWSVEMAQAQHVKTSALATTLVKNQATLFIPILLFARFAWVSSSLQAAIARGMAVELVLLVVHFAWVLGTGLALLPSPLHALLWVVTAQLAGGFLLGIVFVQSHNGMEVYCDDKDFVTAQVVSTRNIRGGWWTDWFTGGLNRQIEHHLFPTLPRHSLPRAAQLVRALCNKHGLVYEDIGMAAATAKVVNCLAEVAAQAFPPSH